MKTFLDTHAAVILWSGEEIGKAAEDLFERSALFLSPVVRLELSFLREIGRFDPSPEEILGNLMADFGIRFSNDPMEDIVAEAMPLSWTRDPFDRLLVATAALHRAPFVTRDQTILENFALAVW